MLDCQRSVAKSLGQVMAIIVTDTAESGTYHRDGFVSCHFLDEDSRNGLTRMQ